MQNKNNFDAKRAQGKIKNLSLEDSSNKSQFKIDPAKFVLLDNLCQVLQYHCYDSADPQMAEELTCLELENLYNLASSIFELFRPEIELSKDKVEYKGAFSDALSLVLDDTSGQGPI